jgi:hypothetical protein
MATRRTLIRYADAIGMELDVKLVAKQSGRSTGFNPS